jgi:hypothetical protein
MAPDGDVPTSCPAWALFSWMCFRGRPAGTRTARPGALLPCMMAHSGATRSGRAGSAGIIAARSNGRTTPSCRSISPDYSRTTRQARRTAGFGLTTPLSTWRSTIGAANGAVGSRNLRAVCAVRCLRAQRRHTSSRAGDGQRRSGQRARSAGSCCGQPGCDERPQSLPGMT